MRTSFLNTKAFSMTPQSNAIFRSVNIERSYSSRKSTCSTPIAHEDATTSTNAVEEQFNLVGELFRLRESTKAALQQYWDEAEILQQQCVAHLQFTSELKEQLMEAQKNEDSWRICCLATEARLQSSPEDEDNQLTSNNKLNLSKNVHAWKRGPSRNCLSLWYSEPKLSITHTPDAYAQPTNAQKDDQIKVLPFKLSSRDEAMISLEQTLERHVKDMKYTQAETLCSMETQRVKEKRMHTYHKRHKERLENFIACHRQHLIGKAASVEAHQTKLSDCYILVEKLTSKLAENLQILRDVENKVPSLNYNLFQSESSKVLEKTK